MAQEQTVIGAMSGTSLDGLDLCAVKFKKIDGDYKFEILAADTIPYGKPELKLLETAFHSDPEQLKKIDISYGQFIGDQINLFIDNYKLENIDLIGSHGHTIFHEPDKGITVQIGSGEIISNQTKITTICNFRIKDVELGGQGAPLVPIGDKFLFNQNDSCLNLGGIANISFDLNSERIAFDISPCNLPLNKIMTESYGQGFDEYGATAQKGEVIEALLDDLNGLEYYKKSYPKSLGVEWLNKEFYPILEKYRTESVENTLRTIVEHETDQIAKTLSEFNLDSCLVTGGGTFNSFFIKTLKSKTQSEILIPSKEIIEFKEALIFAFLAFLNINDEINTLKSVTGASKDSIGGILHKSF